MKAKDLLLVGSGLAIGYLIFKKDLFKRVEKATKDVSEGALSGMTELVNPQISDPKTEECEKKWEEIASRSRFASEEGMLNAKKEFMINCLVGGKK
jgi:hypothetical protein